VFKLALAAVILGIILLVEIFDVIKGDPQNAGDSVGIKYRKTCYILPVQTTTCPKSV